MASLLHIQWLGLPIGAFYGYRVAGIFQTQDELDNSPKLGGEKLGDIRYEDTNGDGILNGDDRVYLGSPIPKLTYSFNAGVEWNGFDLNADILGSSGNYVFNAKETFRFSVYNWGKTCDRSMDSGKPFRPQSHV